jgi:hypothetical protein
MKVSLLVLLAFAAIYIGGINYALNDLYQKDNSITSQYTSEISKLSNPGNNP